MTTTPPVPHIRIVPHLDAPRSLHFDVVDKDVPEGFVLKIGRFTDKQAFPNRVTFKSKVVSRGHAEIYTEQGKFYIRDTKSSSGTFLNHARLSPPGAESKPTLLKDGDVVQLGVDYQGGTQEIYRCVKMRLELNRSWQQQANPFRMNTLKVIRSLTTANAASSTDCCICLFRIASFQSLFVAPCSHVYHYKCIRPLLMANHPGFLCPLCRTFADLEDSVEIDDPIEEEIPAEEVAAAIEKVIKEQESVVEQVCENPAPPEQARQAEVLAEEAYAPTPPSEQAHTFQPPENVVIPVEEGSGSQQANAGQEPGANNVNQDSQDNEIHTAADTHSETEGSTMQAQDVTSTLVDPVHSSPADASSSPMDISTPHAPVSTGVTSASSLNSSAQQSPSSAFFMAPSPPAFSSNTDVTPIPVGSSSRHQSSQSHHRASVSPSNYMAAASHMVQNVVRSISIPTRNRSRTNSNSPLNPMVHVQSSAPSPRTAATATTSTTTDGQLSQYEQPHQQQRQQQQQHQQRSLQPGVAMGHGQGEVQLDVFGKTLVATPQSMMLGNSRSVTLAEGENDRPQDYYAHGSFNASGLVPVAEMESEQTASQEDQSPHNGDSNLDPPSMQQEHAAHEQQHQQLQHHVDEQDQEQERLSQPQTSQYSLQQSAETSV
ncbi:hypothetical protein BGZ51_000292 [Haplosporangium sp. Z 767]|nr:hypothetical protein BGZ51_000292 [Haplosporangium sp. Z 767]KAF9195677.1 hypothetical protein BGZ50_003847 [Haplosporangium sp. Z 11]